MSNAFTCLSRARHVAAGLAIALAAAVVPFVGPFADPAGATAAFAFTRLAGDNRFVTAQVVAESAFAGADTALIATGAKFPDALAGAYLAGDVDGPTLLTRRDEVPDSTSEALSNLGVDDVIILGGQDVVSSSAQGELQAEGYNVTRIAGANRYDTARRVAQTPDAATIGEVNGLRTAIVTSGQAFPDAITGSPLSYASRLPTLLTKQATLVNAARSGLSNLEIEQALILGGTAAVSTAVEEEIEDMGITVVRVGGTNRSDTAAQVADFALDQLGFSNVSVNLARGDDFADALTGGVHGGVNQAPTLLTPDPERLGTFSEDWLEAHASTLDHGHIFGGPEAIIPEVEEAAEAAAGAGSTNQSFSVAASTPSALSPSSSGTSDTGRRTYTAVLPSTVSQVDVALYDAADVFTDAAGNVSFMHGATRTVIADRFPENSGVSIEEVNGSTTGFEAAASGQGTTFVADVTPVSNEVDIVVDSVLHEQIIPVVFEDSLSPSNQLNLRGDGTHTPNERFGIGGQVSWIPVEASTSSASGTVAEMNDELDYYTFSSATLSFDSTDTFQLQGSAISIDAFQRLAGPGASVSTTYDSSPGGTSIHNITGSAVTPVGWVDARRADTDGDDTEDDVAIKWATAEVPGVVYDVFRSAGDDTFDSGDVLIAAGLTTTSFDHVDRQDEISERNDFYLVFVRDPGTNIRSPRTASQQVFMPRRNAPPSPDSTPQSNNAVLTNDASTLGASCTVDGGFLARDRWEITFSEGGMQIASNATISIENRDIPILPVQAVLRNGDNANFTLNQAGNVMTVAITEVVTSTGGEQVEYPVTMTASSGITDSAGQSWTFSNPNPANQPDNTVGDGSQGEPC